MRGQLAIGIALVGAVLAGSAQAEILPPNLLHLQDDGGNGMTEETFDAIINDALRIYAPIVKRHGATLKVNRLWDSDLVNAGALQIGRQWQVKMYGGLARRSEITSDGFTMVLCHEIGHHLAGYYFKSTWAASEGQSDYFASQSCARLIWQGDILENAKARRMIDRKAKSRCDDVWSTEAEQNLCYRTMMASKSISNLLGALESSEVSFAASDRNTVRTTYVHHPRAQCRLDTYVSGALCPVEFDKDLIPGKRFGTQRNGADAADEAAEQTCMESRQYSVGVRPRCWFAPTEE